MRKKYCFQTIFIALMFMVLLNSCLHPVRFPLTIEDIDTLSVYRIHQDSIVKLSRDTTILAVEDSVLKTNSDSGKFWTICTGVFKEKQNAKRKYQELKNITEASLIIRDSLFFVTTQAFISKDSALEFSRKIPFENYIFKLKPSDVQLSKFPD